MDLDQKHGQSTAANEIWEYCIGVAMWDGEQEECTRLKFVWVSEKWVDLNLSMCTVNHWVEMDYISRSLSVGVY